MSGFNVKSQNINCSDCRSCGKRAKAGCIICGGQVTYFDVPYKWGSHEYQIMAKCNCNTCEKDIGTQQIGSQKPTRILLHGVRKTDGGMFYRECIHPHDDRYNGFCSKITGKRADTNRKDWNDSPF